MSRQAESTTEYFAELQAKIDEIPDNEERARFRREWGLLGLDRNGRVGATVVDGSGQQAQINQAAAGTDLDRRGKKVRRQAKFRWRVRP